MAEHALPVAMVGATYREAPTSVRSRLVEIDQGEDGPTRKLMTAGHVDGVVRIETCSRTEWLLSAKTPEYAARLLEGALMSRLGPNVGRPLRVRTGAAALNHFFTVAVGLDAVAEGEMAVGKQMLRSFARSNADGSTDAVVRQCWKHLDLILHERREAVPAGSGLGVQSLVVDHLLTRFTPDSPVALLGRGEIGHAVRRALERANFRQVFWHSRATLSQLMEDAKHCSVLIVCTGGPDAWLDLPARQDGAWCVDVGSPAQIRAAEGWQRVGLDQLLGASRHSLNEDERKVLDDLVSTCAARLHEALTKPAPARVLAAIDSERQEFLHNTLPQLLSGLPPAQARNVERAVAAFTHSLIRHARGTQPDDV